MNCPQCAGIGLIGTVRESVCPQCMGTGTISVDDTQTFATVSTTAAAQPNSVAVVVSKPTPIPAAAIKVVVKGK